MGYFGAFWWDPRMAVMEKLVLHLCLVLDAKSGPRRQSHTSFVMDNLVAAYLLNPLLDLACAAGMGKVLGSLTRKGYLLRVLGTKPEQYMVANRPPLWLVSSNSQSKGGS